MRSVLRPMVKYGPADSRCVEALRQFPFLDSNDVINDLVTELPNYVAAAQDVMPCEEDKV